MKDLFDIIVVGAGASGLMCAAELEAKGFKNILILESNKKPALKLKASGGGKCNLTNVHVDTSHFLGDSELIQKVLHHFDKEALLSSFESRGLTPVIRKDRYYFCSRSSDEIINILLSRLKNTIIEYDKNVLSIEKNELFSVKTVQKKYHAKYVVVATGGPSYKELGASDFSIKTAQSFGIETKPFLPALVGLTLQPKEFWMKELSGISFPAEIIVANKRLNEDLLFAHKGISGPVVLSASLYWHKGEIIINFLPNFSLQSIRKERKNISTALPLPKRFIKSFCDAVRLEDKPCVHLTDGEWLELSKIQEYSMAPSGTFGLSKAEACRGGVSTDELDHTSLEALKVQNLYFIGEGVDVTGELGGYNFQWAFSSAVYAAQAIAKNH